MPRISNKKTEANKLKIEGYKEFESFCEKYNISRTDIAVGLGMKIGSVRFGLVTTNGRLPLWAKAIVYGIKLAEKQAHEG